MKNLNRCFCTLFLLVLEFAFLQGASAEGYLYLFKKDTGDFAAVEALKEEVLEGNIKLTTVDGKVVVWGNNLLVCKFARFDEAKESRDPAEVKASIDAIEGFIREQPDSLMYLQSLLNQRKEFQARLENNAEESTEVTDDALGRFLADKYNEERKYSVEYLEAKLKRGEEFKKLLPGQSAQIADYLKPWAEELQNRQAGLVRFEGSWVSAEALAKVEQEKIEKERKAFFEKELFFPIPAEAISEKTVYIGMGAVGASVLILLALTLYGLLNITPGFGLAAVLALCLGLGGLGVYGYGAWSLFVEPAGYTFQSSTQSLEQVIKNEDDIEADEWIFRIHRAGVKQQVETPLPGRFVLEDAKLNAFLQKYLKVHSDSTPGAYAITRTGLKVRVLVDRILVFDELKWFNKSIIVCYSFSFAGKDGSYEFFGKNATAGDLPLPGRIFQHLWDEVQPVVSSVLEKSRVLNNYQIVRIESGTVELVSNRVPKKVVSH